MSLALRVPLLLFTVAWGANHFVPLLMVYSVRLGLSPRELAALFGIYAVGLVPGLLLGGPLSDRVGRRRVVIPSALMALAGTLVLGTGAVGFSRLLLGRFIVGLGSGAAFSVATAWVQDLASSSDARGAGARRTATALSAGFGGGPLLASAMAQWLPYPLVLPYAVQAAMLVLAIWLVAAAPSAGQTAPTPATQSTRPRPPGAPFLPAGFVREIVPTAPWVFGLASISFIVLPANVRDRVASLPVVYTGVVTATTLLAGVLVQAPLRSRSAREAGQLGIAAGVLGLVVATLATWTHSAWGALLAAVILGTGYGGCLVAGLRFVETRSDPGARGRSTGIFYVLAYVGFAAPLLLAALSRRYGPTGALTCAVALALGCLVLLWSAPGPRSGSS